mgnify:CR=1 FL=1
MESLGRENQEGGEGLCFRGREEAGNDSLTQEHTNQGGKISVQAEGSEREGKQREGEWNWADIQ